MRWRDGTSRSRASIRPSISSSPLTDAPAFGCAADDAKQGQLWRSAENISWTKMGRVAADRSSGSGRWSAWANGRAAPERRAPTPGGSTTTVFVRGRDAAHSSDDRLRFVLQPQTLPQRSAHNYRFRGGGLGGRYQESSRDPEEGPKCTGGRCSLAPVGAGTEPPEDFNVSIDTADMSTPPVFQIFFR